jgi:hypothetical protein
MYSLKPNNVECVLATELAVTTTATDKEEATCVDGTYPHPTNCEKYFTCINSKYY